MKRLKLLVEGQTEHEFVKLLLLPHFYSLNLQIETVILVTSTSRTTGGQLRGGVSKYEKIRGNLNPLLHECRVPDVWASTFFDLYALPDDFPGKRDAPTNNAYTRIKHIEDAFSQDWQTHPNGRCLLPYIQLHEIEALLLCDVAKFDSEFIETDEATGIRKLKDEVSPFASPEEINEGPNTSPSKRIIRHLPDYDYRKRSAAANIADKIGLSKMRDACPHFHEWITRLEALAAS